MMKSAFGLFEIIASISSVFCALLLEILFTLIANFTNKKLYNKEYSQSDNINLDFYSILMKPSSSLSPLNLQPKVKLGVHGNLSKHCNCFLRVSNNSILLPLGVE